MTEKFQILGGGAGLKALTLSRWLKWWNENRRDAGNVNTVYRQVAWVYRSVQLRAGAVSRIPWGFVRGDTEADTPLGFEDINWTRMLYQTEAALCLFGAAYLLKLHNGIIPTGLQWLNPQTMRIDREKQSDVPDMPGGFIQTNEGGQRKYNADQIVYFRLFNPDDDLGPGVAPAEVALTPSGQIRNTNIYTSSFFQNGALPAMLLTTDTSVPKLERGRMAAAWKKLFKGKRKAWQTAVLEFGLKAQQLSSPLKELVIAEIMTEMRKQIAAAFGIPQTMLEDAARMATAEINRISFWTETIFPEAEDIQDTMNEQLWKPFGVEWKFKYGEVEAVQQSEATKSKSLAILVREKIYTIDEARAEMGKEPMKEEDKPKVPAAFMQQKKDEEEPIDLIKAAIMHDLHEWRRKVKRCGACEFDSGYIPKSTSANIWATMKGLDDVAALAFLDDVIAGKSVRIIPEGANDPLPPSPPEVIISEHDIEIAIKEWDRVMPDLKGLLDAEVVGQQAFDNA